MNHLFNKTAGYQSKYPNIQIEVAGSQKNYQTLGGVKVPALGATTLRLLSDWIYHLVVGLFGLVNSFFEVLIAVLQQMKLLPYFRFGCVIMLAYLFFFQQKENTEIIHTAYAVSASGGDSFTPKGALVAPIAKKPKKKLDPFATAYIQRFSKVAQSEMNKFGIPASIKLAQGLLESNNGKSRLAAENFNHFGLKCFSKSCQKGHCSNHSDDSHKDFFRKYQSAWESWRDHSQFLMGPRYAHLQKHDKKDYKKWAKGLKKAGYATDKKYDKKLIDLIEQYELHRFDYL